MFVPPKLLSYWKNVCNICHTIVFLHDLRMIVQIIASINLEPFFSSLSKLGQHLRNYSNFKFSVILNVCLLLAQYILLKKKPTSYSNQNRSCLLTRVFPR